MQNIISRCIPTVRSFMVSLAAALSFTAVTALADPPIPNKYHWRNTQHAGHYVLYDHATRTYVETVDCRAAWRFTLVQNQLNNLILFDASRGMTVRLNYEGMFLKPAGAADFSFYQNGTFDKRINFQHFAGGAVTGSISKGHGCTWTEKFAGQANVAYSFVERSTTPQSIEIYDRSRDLSVRLDNTQMWLKIGAQPFGFFKSGAWH